MLSYGGRLKVEGILNNIYYCEPHLERKFKYYNIIKDYGYGHERQKHRTKKYSIYKDGISYYERICLYCGKQFLAKTNLCNRGNNAGCFCNQSHATLYYFSNLKKEVISYANC